MPDGVQKTARAELPIQQLAILATCRLAEPLANLSIIPYLPEMMRSFNIPEKDIGRWCGTIVAVFALLQCPSAIICGHLSSRYGRKNLILLNQLITTLATLIWGFSVNTTMAVVARALIGLSNGDGKAQFLICFAHLDVRPWLMFIAVALMRTMVAELVPQKELQPRAFSILPTVYATGSLLGPALGGILFKPSIAMPAIFGSSRLFNAFPAALPSFVVCVVYIVGLVIAFLFLEETYPPRRAHRDIGLEMGKKIIAFDKSYFQTSKSKPSENQTPPSDDLTTPLLHNDDHPTTEEPHTSPALSDIFTRRSTAVLRLYFIMSGVAVAFEQLLTVFLHHPLHITQPSFPSTSTTFPPSLRFSGGLNMSATHIGTLLFIAACSCVLEIFFVYPTWARHFGILNLLRICVLIWPFICIVVPFHIYTPVGPVREGLVLLNIALNGWYDITAGPSVLILLRNTARNTRILGTLNGVGVAVSALGRTVAPAVMGALESWGMRLGVMVLPFWTLAVLYVVGMLPIWWMTEESEDVTKQGERERLLGNEDEEIGSG